MGAQNSKLIDVKLIKRLSFLEDGKFAKIYKGHFGDQSVSIKVPRVNDKIRKDKKRVKTHIAEVKKLMPHLKKPKNEYLVRVFGVAYDDFRKEVWIIREFVDGTDLGTLLKNPSLCPNLRKPEQRLLIAHGISRGIRYLHHGRSPIVHGDFKTSDVLIDASTLHPKITNFGLWNFKMFFVKNTLPDHVTILNPFQSPEVLLDYEGPSLFSDIWSTAAVILECIIDHPPWDFYELCSRYHCRQELQALRIAMEREEDPTVVQYMDEVRDNYPLDFLRDCFAYTPSDRLTAKMIEENLGQLTRTPTWTNIAYQKYYS